LHQIHLALLHDRRGHHLEAELLYERARAIQDKAHGPDHPDVASALNGVASLS
jgi:hypothetical protein